MPERSNGAALGAVSLVLTGVRILFPAYLKIKKEVKMSKQKFPKLHPLKLGIAVGISIALFVFITTLVTLAFPQYNIQHSNIIKDLYSFLGYDTTFLGAILGAIYSFIDAFILTFIFAWIYNKLI